MTLPLLHYVYDPLCGWCYAASALVEAAVDEGFGIALHGGNLWERETWLTSEKRNYIKLNDERIAELTGMLFGSGYLDAMLNDTGLVFWSRPTIAAILAADTLRSGAGLSMLHAIQAAHYVRGLGVVQTTVLSELAQQIDLESQIFIEAFHASRVDEHIRASRRWMSQFGLRGFPGFVLEHAGTHVHVQHEPFYGKPDAFVCQLHRISTQRD